MHTARLTAGALALALSVVATLYALRLGALRLISELHGASDVVTVAIGVAAALAVLWRWDLLSRSERCVARALGVPISNRGGGPRSSPRPPPPGVLSVLPTAYLEEAAALSAAAFAPSSPSYVYICGSSALEQRLSFTRWLFERNFAMRDGTGCNRCVFDEEGKLICFFMFVTPGVPDPDAWAMVRSGMLTAPFKFGFGTVKRLLQVKTFFEAIENEIRASVGDRPVCHLERMSVAPDCQGKGVGTRALRAALDEAAQAGWAVLLATQEERNVTFYERLGFRTIRTAAYTPDPEGWGSAPNYFMIKT